MAASLLFKRQPPHKKPFSDIKLISQTVIHKDDNNLFEDWIDQSEYASTFTTPSSSVPSLGIPPIKSFDNYKDGSLSASSQNLSLNDSLGEKKSAKNFIIQEFRSSDGEQATINQLNELRCVHNGVTTTPDDFLITPPLSSTEISEATSESSFSFYTVSSEYKLESL
ncbi:14581_t:CDS:1, partial [Acaulospora morrowiae]